MVHQRAAIFWDSSVHACICHRGGLFDKVKVYAASWGAQSSRADLGPLPAYEFRSSAYQTVVGALSPQPPPFDCPKMSPASAFPLSSACPTLAPAATTVNGSGSAAAAVPFALASVEDALADFARGDFLVVVDDESRENEGDLIIAAEKITVRSARPADLEQRRC